MRIVVQRVSSASVTIGGEVKSSISRGLLVLLGIGHCGGGGHGGGRSGGSR
ncbi:MAG: D-aminoacyl-tRNA deacylase [Bacteroidales bacterium]|nr:D-aminoacyl-tRNA deacylase [Bacteroidales bacterium]